MCYINLVNQSCFDFLKSPPSNSILPDDEIVDGKKRARQNVIFEHIDKKDWKTKLTQELKGT